jgi:sugar phosphate isomerase/epimerase
MAIDTIMTPVLLSNRDDLLIRIALLHEYVRAPFRKGIEAVDGLGNYFDQQKLSQMAVNADLARQLGIEVIGIHAPVTRDSYVKAPTNLSRFDLDLKPLRNLMRLASQIRAGFVNFHVEACMKKKQLRKITKFKRKLMELNILRNLRELHKEDPFVQILLENMPYPIMGDAEELNVSGGMIFDPFFHSLWELRNFCLDSLFDATFDTCHWGARPWVNHGEGIIRAFRKIQKHTRHIHLSDVRGIWVEDALTFTEGIVPGEGRMGDNLARFVRHLHSLEQLFTLTLEVSDSNFKRLEESRRGMKWLMHHLA